LDLQSPSQGMQERAELPEFDETAQGRVSQHQKCLLYHDAVIDTALDYGDSLFFNLNSWSEMTAGELWEMIIPTRQVKPSQGTKSAEKVKLWRATQGVEKLLLGD
jgi:hypothetical protein